MSGKILNIIVIALFSKGVAYAFAESEFARPLRVILDRLFHYLFQKDYPAIYAKLLYFINCIRCQSFWVALIMALLLHYKFVGAMLVAFITLAIVDFMEKKK